MTTEQILTLKAFRVVARFTKPRAGLHCKTYSASDAELALRFVREEREKGTKVFEIHAQMRNGCPVQIGEVELEDAVEPQFAAMHAVARVEASTLAAAETRRQVAERAHRRLIAPDLDTTGDFLDARAADNPLLAWVQ